MGLRAALRRIRKELRLKDAVRERVLRLSRGAVRLASEAIIATHRGDFEAAQRRLEKVRAKLDRIEDNIKNCPEMAYSGSVYTAYQEYVEAQVLLSFVLKKKIAGPELLKVPSASYVLGLADAVGELRRRALDSLRVGDLREANRCLEAMEAIYDEFIAIERGYALIPGFRRKSDSIRRRIEQTRGDIATAKGIGSAKA